MDSITNTRNFELHYPEKYTLQKIIRLLKPLSAGFLFPLGFAPFHMPGLLLLSLAFFFLQIDETKLKPAFYTGLLYGVGSLSFGVSWVYVSIHTYGHLHPILSGFITLLFVLFFSLYSACFSLLYSFLSTELASFARALAFSSVWFLSELARSKLLGGFPWLLVGFSQMDSPLQHLLPIIGVLGTGFMSALIAAFLALSLKSTHKEKFIYLGLFIFLLLLPNTLQSKHWTISLKEPISVGIIQADLSMRDKWDEALFDHIVAHYQENATKLMQTQKLVIMPESAIPLPTSHVGYFLEDLDRIASNQKSAVLLGIASPSRSTPGSYYNSLLGLGEASGIYSKQHLVPFGEYTPPFFAHISQLLNLTSPNMVPGSSQKAVLQLNDIPIASLICYELAYPEILRKQLPEAQFIISVSDDGWFGHSLAIYQHQQMAQVLSKQTGRYQVLSNNDGLSSIINTHGEIIDALPAFTQGLLTGHIYSATDATPWVKIGDTPFILINTILIMLLFVLRVAIAAKQKRRYPNQPS